MKFDKEMKLKNMEGNQNVLILIDYSIRNTVFGFHSYLINLKFFQEKIQESSKNRK